MELTRRSFLKAGGAALAVLTGLPGLNLSAAFAYSDKMGKLKAAKVASTICPYCGVGCGALMYSRPDKGKWKIINLEGDPDHPINRGSLCSKGSAIFQIHDDPGKKRLQYVEYRAAGSNKWVRKSWDWALTEIAKRVYATREASFVEKNAAGQLVNRTEGIASLGGAALDNEEGYLLSKWMRSLGVVYLEHQARICHSPSVAGLAASFGRGAMTNHWTDLQYADAVLVMGANAAENHPISFKWITEAIEKRGAKLISVDPRFTRTSARAHIYAPLRAGTDIALLGGMVKYILDNNLYFDEYVREYTNAPFLINPDYQFADGLFSGYDPAKRGYDTATWQYQKDEKGVPKRDPSMKDPFCVMQLLKKHFERYDLEMVSKITGTPPDVLKQVYDAFGSTGKPNKAGTILYAMGTTHHTYGTQNIRAYSIIQLLLGNMGIAGGGINAMRGESNVQGSTDQALLFHIIPGYINSPSDGEDTIDALMKKYYEGKNTDPLSLAWWGNCRKYLVSLLKEWYGDAAKPENDFAYSWLPKRGANYSHISLFEDMAKGKIKGAFLFGQNPAVGGPNTLFERDALAKLDWMVAVDLWETETSVFWKRDGVNPANIKTEVFRLPALASVEKEGSISNSGRWIQWRYKGGDGPGEAMDDLYIIHALQRAVAKLYKQKGGKLADAVTKIHWPYDNGHGHPDVHKVAKAMNGYDVKTGKQLINFTTLQADGSTACGLWIYSGGYNEAGNNYARRDSKDTHLSMYHNWSYCWPLNRRIIYNRASVNPDGQPWDAERAVITAMKKPDGTWGWSGDIPDGGMPPLAVAKQAGTPGLPFIMKAEGVGGLFAAGMVDGPFPTHYEPMESPVVNKLYPKQSTDPAAFIYAGGSGEFGKPDQYPIIGTTYRLSEHWQAGAMTRNLPWLNELFPELFVEMSEELAKEKGIANGDLIKVWNGRGTVVAKACVTMRFRPMNIDGKTVHTVGIPWHWGYCGLCSGDSANILTPHVGDANTRIPEYKAFLVDIKKA